MVTKHGQSWLENRSAEYQTWNGLKGRCLNTNNNAFHSYGGRGITVCDRWKDSFEDFLADMGPRPSPKHSIDRVNNDLGYSPENCRWATKKEQGNNRRTNVYYEYAGERLQLTTWANRIRINKTTLHMRINRYGWSIEKALTTPVMGK
jgi:hypothetical protein